MSRALKVSAVIMALPLVLIVFWAYAWLLVVGWAISEIRE